MSWPVKARRHSVAAWAFVNFRGVVNIDQQVGARPWKTIPITVL
jgi:hypothetical protein